MGVLPSDTIYGLSCRALDEKAVQRIYELKDRNSNKPFVVLISDLTMLDLLSIDNSQTEVVKKYWPGPLSVIFNSPDSPTWLTRDTNSLAVRWPNDKNLCHLIDQVGPIISTSANPEDQTTAKNITEAKAYFGKKVDFYVDAGELKSEPSTLVKIEDGKLKVIRPGVIKI